jgi:hypothetical protein
MSAFVNSEVWSTFEAVLLVNAKRLVEDIAKKQGSDFKQLWAIIKPQIKISLCDIDLDDTQPIFCSFPLAFNDGAVKTRCRAPCLLGYSACPEHIQKPIPVTSDKDSYPKVDRIFDSENHAFYTTTEQDEIIAKDKNGKNKGVVIDGVFYAIELET